MRPSSFDVKYQCLINLLTNGKVMENIEWTDLLFEIYIQKLSTHIAASIMYSIQV
jgi:hypothetical protein